MKTYTCCICGNVFPGYGNNPYPFVKTEEVCCDACNTKYVIPARMTYRHYNKPDEDGKGVYNGLEHGLQ